MSQNLQPIDPYKKIGLAVYACQIYEAAFVFVAKVVLRNPNPGDFEKLRPLDGEAFKQPTKAILKELVDPASGVTLTQEFISELSKLVEDRHTLVHRLFLIGFSAEQKPSPGDMAKFADSVMRSAFRMTFSLIKHWVDWLQRTPERLANYEGADAAIRRAVDELGGLIKVADSSDLPAVP